MLQVSPSVPSGRHGHASARQAAEKKPTDGLSPESLLALQRAAGNSSVSALIASLHETGAAVIQRGAGPAVAVPPAETELPDWTITSLTPSSGSYAGSACTTWR